MLFFLFIISRHILDASARVALIARCIENVGRFKDGSSGKYTNPFMHSNYELWFPEHGYRFGPEPLKVGIHGQQPVSFDVGFLHKIKDHKGGGGDIRKC